MTYSLEEFKAWLEEKPERKENFSNWDAVYKWIKEHFLDKSLSITDYAEEQIRCGSSQINQARIVQQWLTERERERERESRGGKHD